MKSVGECKLCGENTKLVKSHIIPQAFFRRMHLDLEVPILVTGKKGNLPNKRSPIGIYDSSLLCNSCEEQFASNDSYGISVLLSHFDRYFQPMVSPDRTVAFEGHDVDKTRLLRFLISVLWRASISTQPFYSKVNLGPYEELVKNSMFESTVPNMFNAVLSRWDDADDESYPTTALMDPYLERWGSVNAYRLYLGKTVAYIKIDQRNFAEPFSSLSLQADSPCFVLNRRLSTSNVICPRFHGQFKQRF